MALSFIGATGDRVTIRFPTKKMSFYFNHPHNPDVKPRSQKLES
jgi:hypothetical protein